jgi:hypothetical protein
VSWTRRDPPELGDDAEGLCRVCRLFDLDDLVIEGVEGLISYPPHAERLTELMVCIWFRDRACVPGHAGTDHFG